jgi:hypothetical protein
METGLQIKKSEKNGCNSIGDSKSKKSKGELVPLKFIDTENPSPGPMGRESVSIPPKTLHIQGN